MGGREACQARRRGGSDERANERTNESDLASPSPFFIARRPTDESPQITSLTWAGDGAYLSVGNDRGEVEVWDIETGTKLRTMAGHAVSSSFALFLLFFQASASLARYLKYTPSVVPSSRWETLVSSETNSKLTLVSFSFLAFEQSRVPVLSWHGHLLSSGCRDGSIHHHDVRVARHKVGELLGHTAEVRSRSPFLSLARLTANHAR